MILEGILNRLISNQRDQTSKSLALVLLLWSKKHGGSVSLELGFHRRVITAPALFTWTLCPDRHYGATEPPWTGATDSPLAGSLSPIQLFRWLGRWWINEMGMKWLSGCSLPNKRQRIFATRKFQITEACVNLCVNKEKVTRLKIFRKAVT